MRISRILQLLALAAAMNVPMATQNRAITNIREKKVANSSGFRLSLLPKKSQVKVHEPIDIDFLIRNVTKKTLFLEETFPEREYEIAVRNLRGELVKLTERGETLRNNKGQEYRVLALRVNAGERHNDTIDVAGLYDLSVPGVYIVNASRRVQKVNSNTWTDVESNTLKITVVP